MRSAATAELAESFGIQSPTAAASSSERLRCRQSTKVAYPVFVPRPSSSRSRSVTRRSACANGSGRSSTARTTEKMAEFAPIARASVATAVTVKPGLFRRPRSA